MHHCMTLRATVKSVKTRWRRSVRSQKRNQGNTRRIHVWFGYGPFPVTVTPRIITFLVGNPYKPLFAAVTGKGPHPMYDVFTYIWLICMVNVPTGAFVCPRSHNLGIGFGVSWFQCTFKHILHSTFRVLNLGIGLGFHGSTAPENTYDTPSLVCQILGIGLGFHVCAAPFKAR